MSATANVIKGGSESIIRILADNVDCDRIISVLKGIGVEVGSQEAPDSLTLALKPNWKEICRECHESGGPTIPCNKCIKVIEFSKV